MTLQASKWQSHGLPSKPHHLSEVECRGTEAIGWLSGEPSMLDWRISNLSCPGDAHLSFSLGLNAQFAHRIAKNLIKKQKIFFYLCDMSCNTPCGILVP